MEVINKILPMDKFMRAGHVLDNPITPGETFEDWVNSPFESEKE